MIENEAIDNKAIEMEVPEEEGSPTVILSLPTNLTDDDIKHIVEATLFAANKAVTLDKLCSLFAESLSDVREKIKSALENLMHEYQSRGVELVEVSSGYRFQVSKNSAPWVSRLWDEKPQKYSRALLETLALIAYRQPVTRGEIEEIRGVSVSSNIMRTLIERDWVRIVGHRDVPGKPGIYATTRQFLDYFGLKRLDELPTLAEIRDFDKINKELDFGEYNTQDDDKTETEQDTDTEQIGPVQNEQHKSIEPVSDVPQTDLNTQSEMESSDRSDQDPN